MSIDIDKFVHDQLSVWALFKARYFAATEGQTDNWSWTNLSMSIDITS